MDKLRKVHYCQVGSFGSPKKPELIKEGWFHGFFQEGNSEHGIDPVVLVENLIGEILCLGVSQIKFKDQPDEQPPSPEGCQNTKCDFHGSKIHMNCMNDRVKWPDRDCKGYRGER